MAFAFKITLANIFLCSEVANILAGKTKQVRDDDAGKYLSDTIVDLMGKLEVPLGLKALGYSTEGNTIFPVKRILTL